MSNSENFGGEYTPKHIQKKKRSQGRSPELEQLRENLRSEEAQGSGEEFELFDFDKARRNRQLKFEEGMSASQGRTYYDDKKTELSDGVLFDRRYAKHSEPTRKKSNTEEARKFVLDLASGDSDYSYSKLCDTYGEEDAPDPMEVILSNRAARKRAAQNAAEKAASASRSKSSSSGGRGKTTRPPHKAAPSGSSSSKSRPQDRASSARSKGSETSCAGSARKASSAPAAQNTRTTAAEENGGSERTPEQRITRVIAAIGAVAVVLVIIYYSVFASLLADMKVVPTGDVGADTPAPQTQQVELLSRSYITNVLLLGIDDDGSSGSRSDTMMIVSINTRDDTIRMCSILRDCWVYIPQKESYHRINSAYAYGGAAGAISAVQSNFRIKIDYFASIDMQSMVHLVDAVGGVDIELTAAEANQVNLHSHCGLTTSAGLQHLNGKQAVTYAQIRKIDSDFGRTGRQRTLINAIIAQCRTLSVGELMNMVKTASAYVTTDMSSAQVASLAFKALPCLSNPLEQMSIPAEGTFGYANKNGANVIELDLEENTALLHEYISG